MSSKSIIYWASPYEMMGLPDSKRNMITNNLVKTRFILDKVLDNINPEDKVGIKIHPGNAYTTHYLRHDYVREVVKAVESKRWNSFSYRDSRIGDVQLSNRHV